MGGGGDHNLQAEMWESWYNSLYLEKKSKNLKWQLITVNMFFFLMQIVFVLFFYHVIDVLKSAGCYVHSDVAVSANKEKGGIFLTFASPFFIQTL